MSDSESERTNRTNTDPSDEPWAKRAWADDSYAEIAPKYVSMAGRLVERAGVGAGEAVLDVGCGTGIVAVTAARRGAAVTGLDLVPAMLERARENAAVAGLDGTDWREGDATALPFEADAFDATLSNLGHMYGDPPDEAARELARVTRPGGRIAFTSWTPTSPFPAAAGVAATYLDPGALPEFSEPPFLWGDAETVRERVEPLVGSIEFETGTVRYPALSPEHFVEETMTTSGAFRELLAGVAEEDRSVLRERLVETVEPHFDGRENAVELEYLLTSAVVE